MSRKCSITQKGKQKGHKVSHANKKAIKKWEVNLVNKRLYDTETGKWIRLKVATSTLRTISKKGLAATLRDNARCSCC